jgi:hypothetical protein
MSLDNLYALIGTVTFIIFYSKHKQLNLLEFMNIYFFTILTIFFILKFTFIISKWDYYGYLY